MPYVLHYYRLKQACQVYNGIFLFFLSDEGAVVRSPTFNKARQASLYGRADAVFRKVLLRATSSGASGFYP